MSVLLDDKETTIVDTPDRKYVMIDTCYTFDYGWETMVFRCNENGKVSNWKDLDCMRYASKEDASKGHADMVNKWMNHRV